MTRILAFILAFAASTALAAPRTANVCTPWRTVIDAQTAESSRSFEVERNSKDKALGIGIVLIEFTDGDSSVTSVTMTPTTSDDDNTTDYGLESCAVSAGVCTSSAASWSKATPGTANWAWRVDIEGFEDTEYTFAFGGTPAAADLITVRYRECVK